MFDVGVIELVELYFSVVFLVYNEEDCVLFILEEVVVWFDEYIGWLDSGKFVFRLSLKR